VLEQIFPRVTSTLLETTLTKLLISHFGVICTVANKYSYIRIYLPWWSDICPGEVVLPMSSTWLAQAVVAAAF